MWPEILSASVCVEIEQLRPLYEGEFVLLLHSELHGSTLASSVLQRMEYAFSLQAGAPWEEEYPPLPAYQSEPDKKEVYIVQVKGLPWSCSAEDLLNFFSGELLVIGFLTFYAAIPGVGHSGL